MENKETVFAYIGRDNQLHASEKLDTAIEYCRKKDAEKGIKGSTVVPEQMTTAILLQRAVTAVTDIAKSHGF